MGTFPCQPHPSGIRAILFWIIGVLAALLLLVVGAFVYLSVVLAWSDAATQGLGYYGLGPEEREKLKKRLRTHARLLHPVLLLSARLSEFRFETSSFRFQDVSGPKGTCSEESFAAGHAYTATPEDVFVVTQMKCGTTWMQHLVYQILTRGQGDLVGQGSTLYATSPWLESNKSVSLDAAPLVGAERPSRVVKTHFPALETPSLVRKSP